MVSLRFCLNLFFWVGCRSALVDGVGRAGVGRREARTNKNLTDAASHVTLLLFFFHWCSYHFYSFNSSQRFFPIILSFHIFSPSRGIGLCEGLGWGKVALGAGVFLSFRLSLRRIGAGFSLFFTFQLSLFLLFVPFCCLLYFLLNMILAVEARVVFFVSWASDILCL